MHIQYYNRWANHEQSAKLSVDLYAKTEKKMEEMQITSRWALRGHLAKIYAMY